MYFLFISIATFTEAAFKSQNELNELGSQSTQSVIRSLDIEDRNCQNEQRGWSSIGGKRDMEALVRGEIQWC